jgi:hypothetical protein
VPLFILVKAGFKYYQRQGAQMKIFPNCIFEKIDYKKDLNDRQKENFNFQKVSALLADCGYVTLRLSSDWEGADFIAQHIHGSFIKVQLKGRFTIDKKYNNKDLHICFPDRPYPDCKTWYVCPHDTLMSETLRVTKIQSRKGWKGVAHSAKPPAEVMPFLKQFELRIA